MKTHNHQLCRRDFLKKAARETVAVAALFARAAEAGKAAGNSAQDTLTHS